MTIDYTNEHDFYKALSAEEQEQQLKESRADDMKMKELMTLLIPHLDKGQAVGIVLMTPCEPQSMRVSCDSTIPEAGFMEVLKMLRVEHQVQQNPPLSESDHEQK